MTQNKRLPRLRIVAVSLALMLVAVLALGTQASALGSPESGSDAVTGATPNTGSDMPQMPNGGDGQQFSGGQGFPQMPNGGDGQQFSDGQGFPQMPSGGDGQQFSDGQTFPQMPNGGDTPQFSDGQTLPERPEDFILGNGQDGSAAAQVPSGDASNGFGGEKSADGFPFGQSAAKNAFTQQDASGVQLHPAVWALIGFGAALLLVGAGVGIGLLIRRRNARKNASFPFIE